MLEPLPVCEYHAEPSQANSTKVTIRRHLRTFLGPFVDSVRHGRCPAGGGWLRARPTHPVPESAPHPGPCLCPPGAARMRRPIDPVSHDVFAGRHPSWPPEAR